MNRALNALAKVISSGGQDKPSETVDSKAILANRLESLAREMIMTAGMIEVVYGTHHENSLQLKGASQMVLSWADQVLKDKILNTEK